MTSAARSNHDRERAGAFYDEVTTVSFAREPSPIQSERAGTSETAVIEAVVTPTVGASLNTSGRIGTKP